MGSQVSLGIELAQETQSLQNLANDILQLAKQHGATAAEVGAELGAGFSVDVRMGEVEKVEYNRDKGISVTVYIGQCKGNASSSDIARQSIEETVRAACAIAKVTSEDSCAGLADKDDLAWNYPDLDLYHPWNVTPQIAIELALACEARARQADARIVNSDGVSVSTYQGLNVYANSTGFMGTVASSKHGLSCSLIAKQGEGMQRDYYYTSARLADNLLSPNEVADKAVERTLRRLGAKSINTCQVPILFEAPIASSLLRSFLAAINGSSLYRKSSFLLDKLGETVFAPQINIYQRPHLRQGVGSAPFDAEGVKTVDRHFVESGVLSSYALGSYSARKLGLKTTGNSGGVFNLFIEPGKYDFSQLLSQMDTGLLVTELMGQGINMVTGDYSRGAAGFWVEKGVIQYPVEQITIAGNLADMFKHLVQVGTDLDTRTNLQTGSLLIDSMTVAGH
jgi:PmbA protein